MHETNIVQNGIFSKWGQVFSIQTSFPCYYGPPTTKTKPISFLSIFGMILSYFKIKIKRKCMDNGSLTSKHDSPQRIFIFLQRIEGQGRCIEGKMTWSRIQAFFILKNAKFQQRQLRHILASIVSTHSL